MDHKVYFNSILFAQGLDIEAALSLALALHRSSNISHDVEVRSADSTVITINRHAAA